MFIIITSEYNFYSKLKSISMKQENIFCYLHVWSLTVSLTADNIKEVSLHQIKSHWRP